MLCCRIKFPSSETLWKFQILIETLRILFPNCISFCSFVWFFQCEWYGENLKGLHLRLLLLLWVKTMCEQFFRISALTWKTLLLNRLNYLLHRDSLCHYLLWSRVFSITHLYVSWRLSLPMNITTKHHLFIFISPPIPLPLQPSYISKKRRHLLPQLLGAWGNGCPMFLH